jgi:hypothetical protein
VNDAEKSGERKQEAQASDANVTQPPTAPPQEPPAGSDTGGASGNPQPSQPILVRLVGGDDLEPFEEQTLALARESLVISKRTFRIAILGFLAAVAAATFVGVQVFEMTKQTQIFASQSESASANGLLDGMNTRKQLDIAEKQAKAAQDSVKAIQRQTIQQERPWIAADVAIVPPLVFDGQGADAGINVTLTNKGHSAALYTSVWSSLVVDGVDDWMGEQKRLCGIPKLPVNKKSDYGYLIFPGQSPIVEYQPVRASADTVNKGVQKGIDSGWFNREGKVALHIVVCVDYLDTFDARHHQTRGLFMLAYPEKRGNVEIGKGAFDTHTSYTRLSLTPIGHGASAD